MSKRQRQRQREEERSKPKSHKPQNHVLEKASPPETETPSEVAKPSSAVEAKPQPAAPVAQPTWAVTRDIAQALGEKEQNPINQIRRAVECLGTDYASQFLNAAQRVEAAGGMRTTEGSRRRTPGGIFFHLVRQFLIRSGRRKELRQIFPYSTKPKKHNLAKAASQAAASWAERRKLMQEIADANGKADVVKITLIGKLGKVVERQGFVMTIMKHDQPLINMPKGLPLPEKLPPTTYTVYIGNRQWKRIKEAIKNPEDVVIIEGVQIYDAESQTIAVFAMSCTTKLIEQIKRESQRQKVLGETESEEIEQAHS